MESEKHEQNLALMDNLATRSSLTQEQGEYLFAALEPLLLLAASGALADDCGMIEWRTQGRFGRAVETLVAEAKSR